MAIIKYTSFGPYNKEGAPVAEVVKTASMASYDSEYLPEIAAFLKGLSPEAGHMYVLSNALGGSEVWGSNNNGDLFPASPRWGISTSGKSWGYETFKHHADVFRQHRNTKDATSYGKILCSAWNPKMWRVETVAKIRRDQPDIEDIMSDIDAKKPVAVSMGCRIPFDECSYCGNRARTSAQHCDHLRIQLKKVMPNGLLVAMINYYPVFFDQSFVNKGADPAAWAHRKVAEGPAIIEQGKVKYAEEASATTYTFGEGLQKAAADSDKAAAMYKEVPGTATGQVKAEHGNTIRTFIKKVHPKLRGQEVPMPKALQAKIASSYTMSQIWSTLHAAGVDLRPDEFQYMALCQAGQDKMAGDLSDQGVVFDPIDTDDEKRAFSDLAISTNYIEPDLFDLLVQEEVMEKRSYWRPFLMLRAADLCKEAAHLGGPLGPPLHIMNEDLYPDRLHDTSGSKDSSILPVLAALAGAYALARNQLSKIAPTTLARWLRSSPKGTPLSLSAVNGLDRAKVRRALDKDLLSVTALPIAGLVAAEGLRDVGEGVGPRPRGEIYWESPHMKTADVKGFLGRSLIGVPLSYGLAGYYDAKERVTGPLGRVESLVQDHPIATGAAGAGGALWAGKKLKGQTAGDVATAGASATKGKADQVWGLAKKWIGGISKKADLLEAMATNPSLYDIEPAVADRILVDAVEEVL